MKVLQSMHGHFLIVEHDLLQVLLMPRVSHQPKKSRPQESNASWGIKLMLFSEQIRAARALLRWEQKDLALASGVSLPTIKRLEAKPGVLNAHGPTLNALSRALEEAGVQFISQNGGGPGVRLRHPVGIEYAES
jgi:hypothetical protein